MAQITLWEYTREGALEAAERQLNEWKKNNPNCAIVDRWETYKQVTLWNGALSFQSTINFVFEF